MKKAWFPKIPVIPFEGPESDNPLAFRHYNPDEVVDGKTMKEHLRFSIAYWHSFRGAGTDPFGGPTICRTWEAKGKPMEVAKKRLEAAFEFFTKLSSPYYCFHDRDIAPEGKDLAETNRNLEEIAGLAKELQKATGVKLLWGTANLFSHARYMCGAATNPDAAVFVHAAAQVKQALDITKELGGENYVFWGGREGYETLLNTDLKREMDHLAAFLHLAVDYAKKIGFKGQFLIEPKPKEPTKHQYDFDVASGIAFLRTYKLEKHFKFNIETNHATLAGHTFQHELEVAGGAGLLGSVDANQGDTLLGWDTDQFPTDLKEITLGMYTILKYGGLGSGGFNFDAKLRRPSVDPIDLVYAHIGGMDTFALAWKTARRLLKDGVLAAFVKERYASYDSGLGREVEKGKTDLEALAKAALKQGEPESRSGRQEYLENILNRYLYR
ncbi:MAG: xylose isomerase [Puniceicoccaceae bacterium]|nr:MAG: xylose isomerase [Puniceicoccaceae bacterium]